MDALLILLLYAIVVVACACLPVAVVCLLQAIVEG